MTANVPLIAYLIFTIWWMIYTNARWSSGSFLNVSIKVALTIATIGGCFLLADQFGWIKLNF